jgi:hypothetical protein
LFCCIIDVWGGPAKKFQGYASSLYASLQRERQIEGLTYFLPPEGTRGDLNLT